MSERSRRAAVAFLLPLLLVFLVLLVAGAPLRAQAAMASPASIVDGPLGQKLDLFLTRLEGFGFAGSVLVAKDGKVVLQKGYGLADREHGTPYTAGTVFDIGSITKQFTAAAILRLEMAGKLKTGDPIGKYFDGVPADKAGITLHHLLTHSSGLPDVFGDDYDEMPREALVKAALASKLLWPPGTRYRYSNAGYSLLAAVVEKVSGKTYEEFLRDQLFRPAGMEKTGYRLPAWNPGEVAHGYGPEGDWGTPLDKAWAPDGPWWNLRGNGGILSTVGDLYKWHRALEGETILSKEAKEKAFHPWVPENEEASSFYGYGWAIFKTQRGTRLIAHNGGNGIFAADFRRYVDEGLVVLGSSNQAAFKIFPLTPQLARFVFGPDLQMPPEVVRVEPAVLAREAGAYKLPGGGRFVVSAAAAPAGRPALEIAADGPDALAALAGGSPENRAQWAERQERLRKAMERAHAGDYAPLHELFGKGQSLEELTARAKANWKRLEDGKGPFQGIGALGSTIREGQVATYLRLRFARGQQIAEYGWDGPEISNVRFLDEIPGVLFLPLSTNEVASYDPRTQTVLRIGFEAGDGGTIRALVLHAAGGDVRAVRAE
jgi:CubicO group peptidase (beta-lactamase class C family)